MGPCEENHDDEDGFLLEEKDVFDELSVLLAQHPTQSCVLERRTRSKRQVPMATIIAASCPLGNGMMKQWKRSSFENGKDEQASPKQEHLLLFSSGGGPLLTQKNYSSSPYENIMKKNETRPLFSESGEKTVGPHLYQ